MNEPKFKMHLCVEAFDSTGCVCLGGMATPCLVIRIGPSAVIQRDGHPIRSGLGHVHPCSVQVENCEMRYQEILLALTFPEMEALGRTIFSPHQLFCS